MVEAAVADNQVLEMRATGRSYGAIAKALGLGRAREAHDAFQRALRRCAPAEQADLRLQELRRLDVLAKRLADRPDLSEEELARKLRVVARLREMLQSG